jgi:phosphate transport system permease protein
MPLATNAPAPNPPKPPSNRLADALFAGVTRAAALIVFSLLAAILISLLYGSSKSIETFGFFGFIFSAEWDPVGEKFGALIPIFGTLATAAIAMVIAVPVSFGIALFLTELSPPWLKRPFGTAIELLAAIPSIIYGMWGLFVFAPLFMEYVQPTIVKTLGATPLVGMLFGGPPMGIGIFTAGALDHGDPVYHGSDA